MSAPRQSKVSEQPNPFLDLTELATRWRCHRATAYRRMKRFGIRPTKLSQRSILFRVSDIALVEKASLS